MRKVSIALLIALVTLVFTVGNATAGSFTSNDTTIAFPGYFNPAYPDDEMGTPKIQSITVNTYGNGDLQSVVVQMSYDARPLWDSLFINTDGAPTYEGWDYYVKTYGWGTDPGPGVGPSILYDVSAGYSYEYASIGRIGHPAGLVINTDYPHDGVNPRTPNAPGIALDPNGYLGSVVYNNGTFALTYSFNQGIHLDEFVIGYTTYCANDNILIQSPEPGTLLLLGLGLLAVGIRKRIS